ncbi:MAG: hypothetical protein HDS86_03955 [Bacteroidales bacterium]|nr:hypothetical protein [Bacteroidales bacterium]
MKTHSLPKPTKLCSTSAIDRLFSRRRGEEINSALAYPLRVVWAPAASRHDGQRGIKFVISVPKKRLRHAVDRVTMRRRIRESYRLGRRDHLEGCPDVDVIFVYVADRLTDSKRVKGAMERLLTKITGLKLPTEEVQNPDPDSGAA